MFVKRVVRILLFVVTSGVIMTGFALLTLLAVSPVRAQREVASASSSSCMDCHEDLYYLYDTGKWYCVAEARDRCVDCHGGNPDATQLDAAHAGLIAYPVINGDTTKCQECHPQDYAAHVQKFAEVAGIPVVYVAQPLTASSQSVVGLPLAPATNERHLLYEAEIGIVMGLVILVILVALACKVRRDRAS